MTKLNGGLYNFIKHDEIEKLLNEKATSGLIGYISKGFKSLIKAITGKKVKEVIEENGKDVFELKSYDDVVRRLQSKSNIEVYLKSDSPFNVIFGSKTTQDGSVEFSPLQIMCKRLTANVAVSLQILVTDFSAFIPTFLVNKNMVTCNDLQNYMAPFVKAVLMNKLRDIEIDEYGIPSETVSDIKALLRSHIDVPGIIISTVRDITSSNADFVRLRSVADELFVSEKELEFAIRTNEFRNRLAGVENSQKISEARTALDLHKTLSEINKDKALHEDELDEFYMLLSRQKKIREATDEQEIKSALNDIAKLDLMKDDEMDSLSIELFTKKADRSAVAEIMMMQSMSNVETKRIRIEAALANEQYAVDKINQQNAHDIRRTDVINELELDDITRDHTAKNAIKDSEIESELFKSHLSRQKLSDEYSDERFKAELGKQKSQAELALELEERKRRMEAEEMERLNRQNMDVFALWADEDEKKAQNEHKRKIEEKVIEQQHEQTMAQTMSAHEQALKEKDIESRRVSATMSAEQLMAEQAARLDAEAQRRMADALGNTKAHEVEKRLRAEQLEEARIREERIKSEAEERERRLREDQKNFFGQLSSDRDTMLNSMKDIMGMMVGVKNKADEFSIENKNLNSRLADSERHISYRDNELQRMDERLRHEQERNDNTYNKVLEHEEKLQDSTINAIKATTKSPTSQPNFQIVICPSCGKQVRMWKFCEMCGCELDINKK